MHVPRSNLPLGPHPHPQFKVFRHGTMTKLVVPCPNSAFYNGLVIIVIRYGSSSTKPVFRLYINCSNTAIQQYSNT